MTLADLIRGSRKAEPVGFATAILAIPATQDEGEGQTVATIATVAVANPGDAKTAGTDAHRDLLWWRVAVRDPGGRTVEVDAPSGWTLADWQAYADRYHGPGCAVTPIAGLPKPRAPANLDEALRTACGVGGITPAVYRSLLSPQDVADIEAGAIHPTTLKGYALSFAEGMRSGRIGVPEVKA